VESITNINYSSLADTAVSLFSAFLLGGIIGLERQFRQRTAGLRTNVLVAVGAAFFVDIANRLGGAHASVAVISYVVSGIGFLGAGVIMREEGNIRGINTAATIWGTGAIGAAAGADLILEAILGTFFVLCANTLLRPVVNRINRQPLNMKMSEVTTTIYVICDRHHQKLALAKLSNFLDNMDYPIDDLEIHAFGDDAVEIEAKMLDVSIENHLLDHLIDEMVALEYVKQAFWSTSTSE
jgi:putative Mg2+ transporter-C (MgtC) family protein